MAQPGFLGRNGIMEAAILLIILGAAVIPLLILEITSRI
jgi:hypothetical protein